MSKMSDEQIRQQERGMYDPHKYDYLKGESEVSLGEKRLDCPNDADCVPERDCPFYPDVCGGNQPQPQVEVADDMPF